MKKALIRISTVSFIIAISASLLFLGACEKEKTSAVPVKTSLAPDPSVEPAVQSEPIVQVLSVANILKPANASAVVMFNKNAQVFNVADLAVLTQLEKAFQTHSKLKVTFNPWNASVLAVSELTPAERSLYAEVIAPVKGGAPIKMKDVSSFETLDADPRLGVINTTSPGMLTNVVPDMATAQLMFNYLTKQCCAIPGPYGVDYCISFQYAPDGCYARAHKMCYVINNKYHYSTNKIFSFANVGWDQLSVQAQKWGGCCVNWWYHVAPLVNINTPTGVKAFVFDPAMFDQPVLLSVWLHAQENPVCVSWATPNVSMINLQPTTSYAPADYTGYAFVTDPAYSDTNSTLVAYSNLTTCP